MSSQLSRMGLAEGLAIVFITTFASVFLSGWSIVIDRATTASWMIPLIHSLGGVFSLSLLLYVLKNTSGDLYSACEQLLGVVVTRLIAAYYIGIYFLDAGLLLRQFAENTLLTALPSLDFEIAVAWYTLVVTIILYVGIEAVARAGYIVLPMVLLAEVTVLALLTPQYEFLYLTPWNGPGLGKVLAMGMQSTGVNIGIIIPAILATSFQNARTVKNSVLYGLGISTFFKALTLAAYLAAFGTGSGREKVLPFYELARLVYINRFIQRIEALVILIWAIMGILSIAIDIYIGLYLLSRLFNLPVLRPLIIPALLVIAQLAMLPGEITGVITFHVRAETTFYNIGTILIPLVLFCAALLRARRQKICKSAG